MPKKQILRGIFQLIASPFGLYLILLIFSVVQWSWIWFLVVVVMSAILSYIQSRERKSDLTNTYFLGIKYTKDRYNLPPIFGFHSFDERDDTESAEDREIFDAFSSLMTPEQMQRIFPEEYAAQQVLVKEKRLF